MSEETDSNAVSQETPPTISNRRILWVMGFVVIFGSLAGLIFISRLFGIGFLIGGILAFINYYWLKTSLRKMFVETAEGEHRPHYSAARYISRYLALGAVLAIVFLTHTVPVESVVLGLGSFAFAIIIEAFIRIFSFLFKREEI
jgi:hypothetical protein